MKAKAHEGHPHVPRPTKSIAHHLFSTITATEREAKAVTVSTSSASWCCASRKEQPSLEAKRCTATQYLPAGEGNVREGANTGVSGLPLRVHAWGITLLGVRGWRAPPQGPECSVPREEKLTFGPSLLTHPRSGHSLWTWITASKERTALALGFCLMLSSGRGSSCQGTR